MKRWHLIAAIAAIALSVALTIGIMSAIQTSRPSTKEAELQAELAVWKVHAKGAFKQAATLRMQARKKDATILHLKEQLETNQQATDDKTNSITQLSGDSLGSYVSEQLHYLHTAWY